jgi:hypothetical protein
VFGLAHARASTSVFQATRLRRRRQVRSRPAMIGSWQWEQRLLIIFEKCTQCVVDNIQEFRDVFRSAVAQSYPDHFGRVAEQKTSLNEIIVLCYDRKPIVSSEIPDRPIIGGSREDLFDMY